MEFTASRFAARTGSRRHADPPRRAGPLPLGSLADRPRTRGARPRRPHRPRSCRVRPAGGDRGVPCGRGIRRRHRLGADRAALRGARAPRAVTRRRAQSRGRGRDVDRAGVGAAHRRRARRRRQARGVRSAARGARRAAPPAGSHRRGSRRARDRRAPHGQRTRTGGAAGEDRGRSPRRTRPPRHLPRDWRIPSAVLRRSNRMYSPGSRTPVDVPRLRELGCSVAHRAPDASPSGRSRGRRCLGCRCLDRSTRLHPRPESRRGCSRSGLRSATAPARTGASASRSPSSAAPTAAVTPAGRLRPARARFSAPPLAPALDEVVEHGQHDERECRRRHESADDHDARAAAR